MNSDLSPEHRCDYELIHYGRIAFKWGEQPMINLFLLLSLWGAQKMTNFLFFFALKYRKYRKYRKIDHMAALDEGMSVCRCVSQ